VKLTNERLADLAATGAASRWIDAGDATLHVLDYGGDRTPCVVVPGITSPAVAWHFVARELLDVVRPLVLDVRGRGLSGRSASYSTADYAADVEAVWRTLDLSGAILLGHSMGARIAAAAVTRGNIAPAASLLVDPPMSGPGRPPYPMTLQVFQQQLASARAGITAADVAEIYPHWPPAELELRARWLATCDDAAVEQTHNAFEQEDFFDLWPAVPPPATLIFGADSPVVSAAGADEAQRTHSSATLVAVEHAGHMVPWDNLSGFLDAVRSHVPTPAEGRS
jgi:N-formylmaleamate deformylase